MTTLEVEEQNARCLTRATSALLPGIWVGGFMPPGTPRSTTERPDLLAASSAVGPTGHGGGGGSAVARPAWGASGKVEAAGVEGGEEGEDVVLVHAGGAAALKGLEADHLFDHGLDQRHVTRRWH